MSAGFWLTEYLSPGNSGELAGVFLARKGNPHDIVFFKEKGPRLHHAAFTAPESFHIMRACDCAGALGFGKGVERGPGRHGPGHALYVYLRDPDGHRVEIFNTHYQAMDLEVPPVRWDPADPMPRQSVGFAGAEEMVPGGDAVRRRRPERAGRASQSGDARTLSGRRRSLARRRYKEENE